MVRGRPAQRLCAEDFIHRKLVHSLELLQRAHAFRDRNLRKQPWPFGIAHFADVDVAARVERQSVWRDELPRFQARAVRAAEPRDQLALPVDDTQTWAKGGVV